MHIIYMESEINYIALGLGIWWNRQGGVKHVSRGNSSICYVPVREREKLYNWGPTVRKGVESIERLWGEWSASWMHQLFLFLSCTALFFFLFEFRFLYLRFAEGLFSLNITVLACVFPSESCDTLHILWMYWPWHTF